MKGLRRSNNKRTTDKMSSDKLPKNSRNVERLQEKHVKRGRFTEYP